MNIFGYRAIERILVVIGGMLFAYLGYRLFIFGVSEGFAKLEGTSSLFKLSFSGTGPGLFFMAFGAIILIYALHTGNVTELRRAGGSMENGPSVRVSGEGAAINPKLQDALIRTEKSLTASGPIDRFAAMHALTVNLPSPTPEVQRLGRRLYYKDPKERIKAIRECVELDYPGHIINDLDAIADNEENEEVRKEAAKALSKLLNIDVMKDLGFDNS